MTTVLMFLMVFMLAYGIYFLCTHLEKEEKNGKKAPQKDGHGWAEILPGYRGRTIEIVVKDPMFGIGVIVGRNARADDMDINVCKKKQLTNTRSSGSDEALRLTPPIQMSLEQCMEFISDDELLEVTPVSLRMRKRILDCNQRRKFRIHGK